jgi:hypothetical protein
MSVSLQIRFFLLQNRQGKTRLSKWYVAIEEADKRKIENEVHRLVTARDAKFTNFVEVSSELLAWVHCVCSLHAGAVRLLRFLHVLRTIPATM